MRHGKWIVVKVYVHHILTSIGFINIIAHINNRAVDSIGNDNNDSSYGPTTSLPPLPPACPPRPSAPRAPCPGRRGSLVRASTTALTSATSLRSPSTVCSSASLDGVLVRVPAGDVVPHQLKYVLVNGGLLHGLILGPGRSPLHTRVACLPEMALPTACPVAGVQPGCGPPWPRC